MIDYRRFLQRRGRLNAAAFIVSGSFALVMGTSLLLRFTGRFDYLLLLGLSTAATTCMYSGVKPSILGETRITHSTWMTPILLMGGGTILAAEASLLFINMHEAAPALYAAVTLASTALMLRGSDILDTIEVKSSIPTEPIKNEEPVIGPLTP